MHLCKPVATLLHALSTTAKRIIIIHDPLNASIVQDATSVANAEPYAFNDVSAFNVFFTWWEAIGKPFQVEVPKGLPSFEGCFLFEMMNFMGHQYDFLKNRAGDLHNTCRIMEGTYIDLLARIENDKN